MIQVSRKDSKESAENMLRRFNRKVQQSGLIAHVRKSQYFEKQMTKSERRKRAIIRNERKLQKIKRIRLS